MMLIDMTAQFVPIGQAMVLLLVVAAAAIAVEAIDWNATARSMRRLFGSSAGVRPARA